MSPDLCPLGVPKRSRVPGACFVGLSVDHRKQKCSWAAASIALWVECGHPMVDYLDSFWCETPGWLKMLSTVSTVSLSPAIKYRFWFIYNRVGVFCCCFAFKNESIGASNFALPLLTPHYPGASEAEGSARCLSHLLEATANTNLLFAKWL